MQPLLPLPWVSALGGPCHHEDSQSHEPFAGFETACPCGRRYEVRGCADADKTAPMHLPGDPATGYNLALVEVVCPECHHINRLGVETHARPETLTAWGPLTG